MGEMKSSVRNGIVSGFLGSLCCVTPLVLVLLGLSTVAGGMGIAATLQQNFRWTLFIPIAAIFLIGSIYFHIKKKEGVCNLSNIKKYKQYVIITLSLAVMVWVALIYLIVPVMFSIIS